MKMRYIVSLGSLVAMLSGGAYAGTFVNDGFPEVNGTPLRDLRQWGATHATSVMVSNKVDRTNQWGTAAAIPTVQTLSNVAALGVSGTNVWTDFWTIPRPFVSASDAAPAVDINSSAMFFVTNQSWAVVYGLGGAFTNVCANDIWATTHTVVNDGSTWHRVSVLHNYTANKWSLFVDGAPLKTNMAFISNVTSYEWFSVQNGGGAASNVTWIDDVLITNRVPPGLTNSFDGDSMSDAWELMYYGNFSAPSGDTVQPNGFNNAQLAVLGANPFVVSANEPGGASPAEYVFGDTTNTAFVSAAPPTVSSPNLNLTFQVVSNRLYRVLGSTTLNGDYGPAMAPFVAGESGAFGQTDANVLTSDSMNYYYRLVAETTNGGVVFMETNAITYAVHVQPRTPTSSSNFWIGITVDYGANNRLDSTLGTQLAQGLHQGDQDEGDRLTVYWPNPSKPTMFYLTTGGWAKYPQTSGMLGLSSNIPFGAGMLIQKQVFNAGLDGTRAVFSGPIVPSVVPGIRLETNWNMIAWPYEGSNSISTLSDQIPNIGQSSDSIETADRIWIYRNGQYKQLRRWTTDGWQFEPRTTNSPMGTSWGYLQQGEGVFYRNAASSGGTWTP